MSGRGRAGGHRADAAGRDHRPAIVAADAAGHDVARLHSGDLLPVFGDDRTAAPAAERGVATEIVPGVPAFAAAAAALGSELTVPGVGRACSSPGCRRCPTDMPPGEDMPDLATPASPWRCTWRRTGYTRSSTPSPRIGGDCPTATVAFASREDQQVVRCPLTELPDALAAAMHHQDGRHLRRPSPGTPKGTDDHRQLPVFGRPRIQLRSHR